MNLFNGMLCAVGEGQGCSAVQNSQSDTHQWWRSPALKAAGHDDAGEPNLNSDQVLGILLYVLQENKRDEFRNWLERTPRRRYISRRGLVKMSRRYARKKEN
jgi:hypothetical protein